jgi:glycosyltransferase involved in cell wall biosynthesis
VPALARKFTDVRFSLVVSAEGADALRRSELGDLVQVEALPRLSDRRVRRLLAEQVSLPALARRRGWDVLHSLASTAPARPSVPSVVTLHDVTFFRVKTFSSVTTFAMKRVVAAGARAAAGLITGSEASRDEICLTLGIEPDCFTVVPHGPGRSTRAEPAAEDAVRAEFGLEGARVLLCVAAKRPHKNQEVLVRALTRLPSDFVLVLSGHPEPYDVQLRALACELGIADRARFVDYVPDATLEALWRLAACAAFPTLGEGFGLPVLEAMIRGVPVACSDIPVLREVGGDIAFYFDPHDPAAAAAAILGAVDGERADAGRRRAAAFTWERAAEGTFDAYERALSARR